MYEKNIRSKRLTTCEMFFSMIIRDAEADVRVIYGSKWAHKS